MTTAETSDARAVFDALHEGDRIKVTQKILVGSRSWTTTTTGTVLSHNRVRTGLHVDRASDDYVFADTVLLKRDGDGELTTVSLDENTQLEVLSEGKRE